MYNHLKRFETSTNQLFFFIFIMLVYQLESPRLDSYTELIIDDIINKPYDEQIVILKAKLEEAHAAIDKLEQQLYHQSDSPFRGRSRQSSLASLQISPRLFTPSLQTTIKNLKIDTIQEPTHSSQISPNFTAETQETLDFKDRIEQLHFEVEAMEAHLNTCKQRFFGLEQEFNSENMKLDEHLELFYALDAKKEELVREFETVEHSIKKEAQSFMYKESAPQSQSKSLSIKESQLRTQIKRNDQEIQQLKETQQSLIVASYERELRHNRVKSDLLLQIDNVKRQLAIKQKDELKSQNHEQTRQTIAQLQKELGILQLEQRDSHISHQSNHDRFNSTLEDSGHHGEETNKSYKFRFERRSKRIYIEEAQHLPTADQLSRSGRQSQILSQSRQKAAIASAPIEREKPRDGCQKCCIF